MNKFPGPEQSENDSTHRERKTLKFRRQKRDFQRENLLVNQNVVNVRNNPTVNSHFVIMLPKANGCSPFQVNSTEGLRVLTQMELRVTGLDSAYVAFTMKQGIYIKGGENETYT